MNDSFDFITWSSDEFSTEANIFIHGYSAGHNDDDRKELLKSIPEFLCGYTNIFAFWDSGHYRQFDPGSLMLFQTAVRLHPAALLPAVIGDRAVHFRHSCAQAETMGKLLLSQLSEYLLHNHTGINTINLIGHSLGGRLVYHCLKNLNHNQYQQLTINDVLLMAAAVEAQPCEVRSMRDQLKGVRLFNAYSKADRVLPVNLGETCIGRHPTEHFENIEIGGFGHTDYWPKLQEVLTKTIFKRDNQLVKSTPDKNYSEDSFWEKLKNFAGKAGREVVEKALQLYYAAQGPNTPAMMKATIYSALGYFIMPVDVIPDVTPVVGFSDDLGILVAVVGAASTYINEEVKKNTTQKMSEWFG